MQLIGMLDSPYVRRAAISLRMLGIPFDHRPLSVFRDFDTFRALNPLVKAPTLVCDDGCILVDSSLIIDYAETLAGRSLMPSGPGARRDALRLVGVALVASEKAVQHFYEHKRAPDKQDAGWLQRVHGQLHDACALLDEALRTAPADRWLCGAAPTQADISVGVAWTFTQIVAADVVSARDYPAFAAFATRTERLSEFAALKPV
ncbi:MAG: glutathione S-transferase family protein [Xanthomonadales bacterium]|nr:glutathione S-transferase family protein [Xanthomonadales bacterium]ODU93354.1 MAG: glutathione S-transferase [Rhodanobacter sp. SCN 66-43]OJY83111.1 MAG: glutathione S-transferase [Xanthomonadales bacterium 66-474]